MRDRFTKTISADINKVIETYRKTAFFVETLKHAGAVTIDILEDKELPAGGRLWRARITESSRVPEFLRASDMDIYMNESAFYPAGRKLVWRISPKIQASRIALEGEIHLRDEGDRTALLYDVSLKVRIPFIGRKLEAYGLKKIGVECLRQADFLAEWLSSTRA